MPAFLFVEALAQRFHQFLEAAERLDQLLFFFRQMFLSEFAQPFLGNGGRLDRLRAAANRLDAAEVIGKDLIETVDEALVLDQRRAGQIVEGLDVIVGDPSSIPFRSDRNSRRVTEPSLPSVSGRRE